MHADTFELVQRKYYWKVIDTPGSTDLRQIYNTIQVYSPDIQAVVASMRQGDQRLIEYIGKYPLEAYKFRNSLEWSAEFYEEVQEVDAFLRMKDLKRVEKARVRAKALLCYDCKIPLTPSTTFEYSGLLFCPDHLPVYNPAQQW